MWDYGIDRLPYSKPGFARRLHAARAARRFPVLFTEVAEGRLHLTAIEQLAPHLAAENAAELIREAANGSKHQIDVMLARRFPRPDVPTMVRTIPAAPVVASPLQASQVAAPPVRNMDSGEPHSLANVLAPTHASPVPQPQTHVHALSPERFELTTTITGPTLELLREAQDLLAYAMPSRDVDAVLNRALQDLVARLKSRKFGASSGARATSPRRGGRPDERRIPAALRRAVSQRDGGRCTFVGTNGHRCEARARLEFDHVTPIASGGLTTAANLRLRCRAHNQHEAERVFGAAFMRGKREAAGAPSLGRT
jgi:5-methylcytosine-specific restriction endonuclease McrA